MSNPILQVALVLAVFVQQPPQSVLQGRVTDLRGMALPGATILLTNETGTPLGSAQTDQRGDYNLAVSHRGLAKISVTLRGFLGIDHPVSVHRGIITSDFGLRLGHLTDPTWTVLSGTVTDVAAKPIPAATVTVVTLFGQTRVAEVRSDDQGAFRVELSESAPYIVAAALPGLAGDVKLVDVGDRTALTIQLKLIRPESKARD